MRAEMDEEEGATIDPKDPQQMVYVCLTCPIKGVNRVKDKRIELAYFKVRFICILSIFAYMHIARKLFLLFF